MKKMLVVTLLVLALICAAVMIGDGQARAQERDGYNYYPLKTAVPVLVDQPMRGSGAVALDLQANGLPPGIAAVNVRLSASGLVAGTAVWCGDQQSAGPIVRIPSGGGTDDDTGATAVLRDGQLHVARTDSVRVWVYILGYWK